MCKNFLYGKINQASFGNSVAKRKVDLNLIYLFKLIFRTLVRLEGFLKNFLKKKLWTGEITKDKLRFEKGKKRVKIFFRGNSD